MNKMTNMNQKEKRKLIKTIVKMRDEDKLIWKKVEEHTGIHQATAKKLYAAEKAKSQKIVKKNKKKQPVAKKNL